ncbi:MAG: DUF3943 domain-containing protein [Bdellovibrionota bacterium]
MIFFKKFILIAALTAFTTPLIARAQIPQTVAQNLQILTDELKKIPADPKTVQSFQNVFLHFKGTFQSRIEFIFFYINSVTQDKVESARLLLNLCDVLYESKNYDLSAYAYKLFSLTFPEHLNLDHAAYFEAFSYYGRILPVAHSQIETEEYVQLFNKIALDFPNSPYAKLAMEKYNNSKFQITRKNYEIAKSYIRMNKHIGAIPYLEKISKENDPSVSSQVCFLLGEVYGYLLNFDKDDFEKFKDGNLFRNPEYLIRQAITYYEKILQNPSYQKRAASQLKQLKNIQSNLTEANPRKIKFKPTYKSADISEDNSDPPGIAAYSHRRDVIFNQTHGILQQPLLRFFITVQDQTTHASSQSWDTRACDFLKEYLGLLTVIAPSYLPCSSLQSLHLENAKDLTPIRPYDFHINLALLKPGNIYRLSIYQWKKTKDGLDPTEISLDFQDIQGIKSAIYRFIYSVIHENEIKQYLTKSGVQIEKDKTSISLLDGKFIDKSTGQALTDEEAIHRFTSESPRQKNFVQAGISLIRLLGLGHGVYDAAIKNDPAWIYPKTVETVKRKLLTGEAIRFDNDMPFYNVGHAFAGSLYFMIAQENGLNTLESFLVALAGSTLWELIVEGREVFSINDTIVTSVASVSIGIAARQMSSYFQHLFEKSGSSTYKRLAGMLSPMRLLNSSVWGGPYQPDTSAFGFKNEAWAQFKLFTGIGTSYEDTAEQSHPLFKLGFTFEDSNIPEYGKAAQVSMVEPNPAFVELHMSGTGSQDSLEDFTLFTKAALLGYFRQNTKMEKDGSLKGYSYYVGLGSEFEYTKRTDGKIQDWFGIVDVIGPVLDMTYYFKGGLIRCKLGVYENIAMVKSYAFEKYRQDNSTEGVRSTLNAYGYYFSFGVTVSPSIEIQYKDYKLEAGFKYVDLNSFNKRDIRSETITQQTSLDDSISTARLSIGKRLRFRNWKFFESYPTWLKLELLYHFREGFIEVNNQESTVKTLENENSSLEVFLNLERQF